MSFLAMNVTVNEIAVFLVVEFFLIDKKKLSKIFNEYIFFKSGDVRKLLSM